LSITIGALLPRAEARRRRRRARIVNTFPAVKYCSSLEYRFWRSPARAGRKSGGRLARRPQLACRYCVACPSGLHFPIQVCRAACLLRGWRALVEPFVPAMLTRSALARRAPAERGCTCRQLQRGILCVPRVRIALAPPGRLWRTRSPLSDWVAEAQEFRGLWPTAVDLHEPVRGRTASLTGGFLRGC
jgi:hypothetical protein